MASNLQCPKCSGPREEKALYCSFCGVVFARYAAAQAAAEAPAAERPPVFRPALAAAGDSGAMAAFLPAGETVYQGPAPPSAAWNPYQASSPIEPESFTPGLVLAARGSRLAAQMLNGVAILGVVLLFAVPGFLIAANSDHPKAGSKEIFAGVVIGLLFWIVTNVRQLALTGQSLGKKWMGIRIVRTSGEPAGIWRLLLLRYLPARGLALIPAGGLLDALVIFGEEQRCIHDYLADTKVVEA